MFVEVALLGVIDIKFDIKFGIYRAFLPWSEISNKFSLAIAEIMRLTDALKSRHKKNLNFGNSSEKMT